MPREGYEMVVENSVAPLRFQSLQMGRGLAAIAVLLYHAADTLMLPKYLGADSAGLLKAFLPGHSGVHYFFILSGFVIYHIHCGDAGANKFVDFFRKRLTRLLPALWVWLTIVTGLLILQPSAAGELFGVRSVIEAFLLVPVEQEVVLKVEWTLRHEVLFYAIFSLFVLNRSVGIVALSAWFTASLLATLLELTYPLSFIFSPLHLLFLFGIAVAHFAKHGRLPVPLAVTVAGTAIYLTVWAVDPGHFVAGSNGQLFGFGLGATLMVAGLIELDRQNRLPTSSVLSFLGDASYSIYLTNLTIVSALCKVVALIAPIIGLPPLLWFTIVAMTATAFGCVFYLLVEKPLLARLSKRTQKQGAQQLEIARN